MSIIQRYRQLRLWNKLSVWGSLASIVALLGWLFTTDFSSPFREAATSRSVQQNVQTVANSTGVVQIVGNVTFGAAEPAAPVPATTTTPPQRASLSEGKPRPSPRRSSSETTRSDISAGTGSRVSTPVELSARTATAIGRPRRQLIANILPVEVDGFRIRVRCLFRNEGLRTEIVAHANFLVAANEQLQGMLFGPSIANTVVLQSGETHMIDKTIEVTPATLRERLNLEAAVVAELPVGMSFQVVSDGAPIDHRASFGSIRIERDQIGGSGYYVEADLLEETATKRTYRDTYSLTSR